MKNEVKTIAEALLGHQTFKLRWVDLYESVYDISDEEHLKMLECKKKEIREMIFKTAQTRTRNIFLPMNDLVKSIASRVRIKRITSCDQSNYEPDKTTVVYVMKQIDEMIESGFLVKPLMGEYVRSLNKTEQKQKHKLFDSKQISLFG